MKLKEATLPEILEMVADDTNRDRKAKLRAYPGERSIIFKWRDPVAMMHKLKINMEDAERFYITAFVYQEDKVRIVSHGIKYMTFGTSLLTFLFGEAYIKSMFDDFGYRQIFQTPKAKNPKRARNTSGGRKCRSRRTCR